MLFKYRQYKYLKPYGIGGMWGIKNPRCFKDRQRDPIIRCVGSPQDDPIIGWHGPTYIYPDDVPQVGIQIPQPRKTISSIATILENFRKSNTSNSDYKCSFCKKAPKFVCFCQNKFFCNDHFGHHLENSGNHNFRNILNFESEVNQIKGLMTDQIKLIGNTISLINQKAVAVIKLVLESTKRTIQELENLRMHYKNILSMNLIAVENFDEIKNTSFSDVDLGFFKITGPDRIEKICEVVNKTQSEMQMNPVQSIFGGIHNVVTPPGIMPSAPIIPTNIPGSGGVEFRINNNSKGYFP